MTRRSPWQPLEALLSGQLNAALEELKIKSEPPLSVTDIHAIKAGGARWRKMGVDTLGGWSSIKSTRIKRLRVESFQIFVFSTIKVIHTEKSASSGGIMTQFWAPRVIFGVSLGMLRRPSSRSC